MSDEIKKARIIKAQKNETALVECPHCSKQMKTEVKALEGAYEYDCPFCEKSFDVDFDDFMKHFIPVYKINQNEQS